MIIGLGVGIGFIIGWTLAWFLEWNYNYISKTKENKGIYTLKREENRKCQ